MVSIADWIMCVITAIYVIATIIICYYNGKSTQTAYLQLDTINRQYAEDNRPELAVYPKLRDDTLCFEIRNIGTRKALNVTISFPSENILPIIDESISKFNMKTQGKNIDFMPQQSLYFVLEHLSLPKSSVEGVTKLGLIYLQLSYSDEDGRQYTTKQIADTSMLKLKYKIT